jgi:hypothetical protein
VFVQLCAYIEQRLFALPCIRWYMYRFANAKQLKCSQEQPSGSNLERQVVLPPIILFSYLRRIVFVVVGYAPLDGSLSIPCALLLLVRVVDVVLLREQVSFDLRILQQLEVSFCDRYVSLCDAFPSPTAAAMCRLTLASLAQLHIMSRECIVVVHTSKMSALLEMVDALPPIALAHLLPH